MSFLRKTEAARRGAAMTLFAMLTAAVVPASALAEGPVERRMCVYDPAGSAGDAYQMMGDLQSSALDWGVRFDLRPFTSEEEAAKAFEDGECQAVLLTGLRARGYNAFAGTVEALGAVPSYDILKRVVGMLANPRAAGRMTSGDHEVAGIFPAGAVYLYLREKIESVEALSDKGVATIAYDDAARKMVERVGARPVSAEVGNFATMFNDGRADACYAPATAFQPMELSRGVSPDGGIVRYPLSQLTLQLVVKKDAVPEAFGENARRYAAGRFDRMLRIVKSAESDIDSNLWIDMPEDEKESFDEVFRDVRMQLRDDGVYDGRMLSLLRRLRCQADESRPECSMDGE